MTINVFTLGCKVNQCESASIVSTLRKNGYNASEGLTPCDVYILNTCSVTAEADKKSRQCIARMRKLNPDCKIIVVGCSSQNNKNQFSKQNVVAVGGCFNKSNFALNALKSLATTQYCNTISDIILYNDDIFDKNSVFCYEYSEYPVSDRTRAFIKIQDGCNRFCTYCIIPYLRGRSRSRSIDDILKECSEVSSNEIVLTGIDVSSYGKDIGVTFVDLIKAMAAVYARKRIGSLECEAIDVDLLTAMRDSNFCPHFHLSLQSGNDEVLRSMNRHYNCAYYMNKIDSIRKFFPNAGITTDIIVGFPTETDARFRESIEFIRQCGFSDIHVFPYSARTGTVAAKKYDMLDPDVVKDRVSILSAIKRESKENFISRNIDTVHAVYVEDDENGYNVGYTPNYIKVYSHGPCGCVTNMRLISSYKDGAFGEPA